MRHRLYILPVILVLLCSLGQFNAIAGPRKPKKKNTETEKVVRVRIPIDLAQLRDSIAAHCERDDMELYSELDSLATLERWEIVQQIDQITGFTTHRPGGTYLGELAVALAKEHLGKPYRWAANGPDSFDCSGFTKYIYRQIGINIPRHSAVQFQKGREISRLTELQEGDLVFFGGAKTPHTIGHVGIVVSVDYERGRFSFIHASSSSGVRISPNTETYFLERYLGAARYIPAGK